MAFSLFGKKTGKRPEYRQFTDRGQTELSETDFVVSRFRIGVVWLIIFLSFIFLTARLLWIQVLYPDRLIEEGNNRVLRSYRVESARGIIFDRSGKLLALSVPTKTVFADTVEMSKNRVTHDADLMRKIAELLELDPVELFKKISKSNSKHLRLKKFLMLDKYEELKKLDVAGLIFEDNYLRQYPTGPVNAQIVGILNDKNEGVYGIEKSFDQYLDAEPSSLLAKRDNKNHFIEQVEVINKGKNGGNLFLSVDDRLQSYAYNALAATVKEYQAVAASAVMIDVRTGEILVMVNYPSFDPNDRSVFDSNLARNRSIMDVFEPGSTIKPLIALAALETGKVSWNEVFDTRPYRLHNKIIRDEHPMDSATLKEIIKYSSNVGMARIGLRIGPDAGIYMLQRFGFGAVSNSGLPAESSGSLHEERRFWSDLDKATLGYGYGISVNTLQLASAYATLANKGARVPVTMLRATEPAVAQQVANAAEIIRMNETLEDVVKGGSGGRAAIDRYRIAGKTGTAHVARGGTYMDEYTASFTGFAPMSNPRFALAVVVFSPQTGSHFGGRVSGPVFREIMARALQLYNVAPDKK